MKRIIFVTCLICAFIFGACSTSTVNAEQNYPLKIWKQNSNGQYDTLYVVDENTGVNYIVVSGVLYSEPVGIAICPRYNADGSLYISN